MKQTRSVVLAVLILGIAVAGCGNKEPEKEKSIPNSATQDTGTGWTIFEPINKK
jgi:hypothetical protein